MRQPRIKQEDIARAVGVSVSTVSRVLSGAPGISPATTARVLRAASDMGTQVPGPLGAKQAARGHGLKRALLFLNQVDTNSGSASIYHFVTAGLRKAAREADLPIEFSLLGDDGDIPDLILGGAETGVLLAGVDPSQRLMQRLVAGGHPAVMVNGLDPTMTLDHVAPNNFFGGRMAAEYLIRKGHRRILHLGTSRRWTLRARTDGFRQAIEDAAPKDIHCDYVTMANVTEREGLQALAPLLDQRPFPYTAIFCAADNVALSGMQALRLRGFDVPGDVSLLGFNGLPHSEMSSPLLSTMAVDWEYLGTEAIRLLLLRHAEPRRPTQKTETEVLLKDRNSVADVN
ncbi:LacI family DNA-binding transcriptional regulator [Oceaniglobus trochenteri]|uniref:LacI family DNA-binding transcriptional regulator n=1 Tax=Oceaniglobus trochenteri TaxID=2763260 RepID=UPI001CFFEF29